MARDGEYNFDAPLYLTDDPDRRIVQYVPCVAIVNADGSIESIYAELIDKRGQKTVHEELCSVETHPMLKALYSAARDELSTAATRSEISIIAANLPKDEKPVAIVGDRNRMGC